MPRDRDEAEEGPLLDYDMERGGDRPLGEAAERDTGRRTAGPDRSRDEPEGRGRRRRRGRRGRGERREVAPLPPIDEDIEPSGEEVDLDYDRDEELDLAARADEEPSEQRQPRGEPEAFRPRHQREEREGRGRGRRRRRGAPGREGPPRDRPADYELDDEGPEPLAGPAEEHRAPHYEQQADDADLHGDPDEGDEEHAGGLPTHKKIPTWDEAIGILIEANMAARANSPDRGRGRGRGRGR